MKRGDIVIVRQKGVFTSKPRPAIVVQASGALASAPAVVVCLITGELMTDPPYFRINIGPTHQNGLTKRSQIMADLPVPILVENIDETKGSAEQDVLARLNSALSLHLGLA